MNLESTIVKEVEYPELMDWSLVERFADGIPCFNQDDPKNPEWKPTPVIELDLTSQDYGVVYVKDESDKRSNPTGTIKDRAAWELATLFRDWARSLYFRKNQVNENVGNIVVPRFSIITAGNVGRSVSNMFQGFGLPPMKLLVDASVTPERLEVLKKLYADIYLVDLKEQLTPEKIRALTNNKDGIDITSVMSIEPNAVFYDWHVHEAFNQAPDEIFVPYGSGRLFENYLTWQQRTIRSDANNKKDPRLKISAGRVASMSILGAEPVKQNSIADKLTKSFNPFVIFKDQDISALIHLAFTGASTGVYKVSEERIRQAYEFLTSKGITTEPSACAGLALYLQRYDQDKIDPRKKILVVNTGKGI